MRQEKKISEEGKDAFFLPSLHHLFQEHHPFTLHAVLPTMDFCLFVFNSPRFLNHCRQFYLIQCLGLLGTIFKGSSHLFVYLHDAVHLASIALPMLISNQGNPRLYNHMGFYLSLSTVRTDKGLTKIPNFRISQPSLITLSFGISIHGLTDLGLL